MSKDKVCNNDTLSCLCCLPISFRRFFFRCIQPPVNKFPVIMQFESLSNEMILECFKYFHAFELYRCFGKLNFRLNKLIRQSPLHLNFEHIRKSVFDQFCKQISLKSEMKNRIYSLKLSNQDTCGQIKRFLSYFSLNEFPNLRSLTLIDIEDDNVDKLKTVLPLMPKLHCLHLIDPKFMIYFDLLMPKLHSLHLIDPNFLIYFDLLMLGSRFPDVPPFYQVLVSIDKIILITNLTIPVCSLENLYQLLKYIPMIKYLTISLYVLENNIFKFSKRSSKQHYAIHLKQLIIGEFKYEFDKFEKFIKYIPNLKSLTISMIDILDAFDASRWEYLIKSSLSYLNIFKFKLVYSGYDNENFIEKKFQLFQNDFWHNQHRWYTAYIFDHPQTFICTIPYLSNEWTYKNYYYVLINNLNIFDNVTHLNWYGKLLNKQNQYRFPIVTSLSLKRIMIPKQNDDEILLEENLSYSLKMSINPFYLKHLDISSYYKIQSSMFIEILNEAPQLSSLRIEYRKLFSYFNHYQLCELLNRRIKQLDIISDDPFDTFQHFDELERFCKIFSNLEQFKCCLYHPNQFLYLLRELSKLSSMLLHIIDSNKHISFLTFLPVIYNLNLIIREESIYYYEPKNILVKELSIWNN